MNGDGRVITITVGPTNTRAWGVTALEGYTLACADTVGNDEKVTIFDTARIKAHARGVATWW